MLCARPQPVGRSAGVECEPLVFVPLCEPNAMPAAAWVKSIFDSRGIAYQNATTNPAYTGSELAEHEHMSGHRVAKVVVAMADGRPVELVLPATRREAATAESAVPNDGQSQR
jgi:hypothetical protein